MKNEIKSAIETLENLNDDGQFILCTTCKENKTMRIQMRASADLVDEAAIKLIRHNIK